MTKDCGTICNLWMPITKPLIRSKMPTPLEAHEEICTLRYEMLCARIKRLEGIIIKACGAMLFGMAGVVYSSLIHLK
jgi:hypothetical protein